MSNHSEFPVSQVRGFTSVRKKTEFLDNPLKSIDIFPNQSDIKSSLEHSQAYIFKSQVCTCLGILRHQSVIVPNKHP